MKKRLIFIILIITLLLISLTACTGIDDSITKKGTVIINVTRLDSARNAELTFSNTNGDMTINGDTATIAVSSRKTFRVTISSNGFKTETVTVKASDFKDNTATVAVEFGNYITKEFSLNILNAGVVPTVDQAEGLSATVADGTVNFVIDNIYNDINITIRADGYETMVKTSSQLQQLKQLYLVHEDHFLVTLNTDYVSDPVVLDEKHDFYLPEKISNSFYFELPQSDTMYRLDNASSEVDSTFSCTTIYDTTFNLFSSRNNNRQYTAISSSIYDELFTYLDNRGNTFSYNSEGLLATCDLYLNEYNTQQGTMYELSYPTGVDKFLIFSPDKTKYVELTQEELVAFNNPTFQTLEQHSRPVIPGIDIPLDYKVYYNLYNQDTGQGEKVYVNCIVDGAVDHSLLSNTQMYIIEYSLDGNIYIQNLDSTINPDYSTTYYINGEFINYFALEPFITIITDIYDRNDNIIYHNYEINANLTKNVTSEIRIEGYSGTTIHFTYDDLEHQSGNTYTFNSRKIYINCNYTFSIRIINVPQDDNNYVAVNGIVIEKKSYITYIGSDSFNFVCASKVTDVSFRLRGKKYTVSFNYDIDKGSITLDYNDHVKTGQ